MTSWRGSTKPGIVLDQAPTERPWGIRDLVVRCPGGGPLIAFGEELES